MAESGLLDIQLTCTLHARTLNSQATPIAFTLPFYLPENSGGSKFVGREGELTKMQAALRGAVQHRRVVVLHGSKGQGKTRLAMEYAQRHREDYSAIVWIDARDELTINQSFARLAIWIINYDQSASRVSDAVQSKDQDQIVTAVKKWFDEPANNSWLIIYDNHWHADPSIVGTNAANTYSLILKESISRTFSKVPKRVAIRRSYDIRKYIPESNHGAVIVASMLFLDQLGDCISVRTFELAEDSLDLLLSSSCREDLRQGKLFYPSTRIRD